MQIPRIITAPEFVRLSPAYMLRMLDMFVYDPVNQLGLPTMLQESVHKTVHHLNSLTLHLVIAYWIAQLTSQGMQITPHEPVALHVQTSLSALSLVSSLTLIPAQRNVCSPAHRFRVCMGRTIPTLVWKLVQVVPLEITIHDCVWLIASSLTQSLPMQTAPQISVCITALLDGSPITQLSVVWLPAQLVPSLITQHGDVYSSAHSTQQCIQLPLEVFDSVSITVSHHCLPMISPGNVFPPALSFQKYTWSIHPHANVS